MVRVTVTFIVMVVDQYKVPTPMDLQYKVTVTFIVMVVVTFTATGTV